MYFRLMYNKAQIVIKRTEKQHASDIAQVREEYDRQFKEASTKMENLKKQYYAELQIKDEIIQRHANYEDVLKKELIFAKNILKNPKIMDKIYQNLNYDRIEVYDFKSDKSRQIKSETKEPVSHRRSLQFDSKLRIITKQNMSNRSMHSDRLTDNIMMNSTFRERSRVSRTKVYEFFIVNYHLYF